MNSELNYIASKVLEIETYKGEFIGFFHTGGSKRIKGWWEWKNGAEGGELHVEVDKNGAEIVDFDGANDLPKHVRDELKGLSIEIDS